MLESKLGIKSEHYLAEPLDTWLTAGLHDYAVPEAAGSSARVFLYRETHPNNAFRKDLAFKVMRHDKIAYASPLFKQELNILPGIAGKSGLTPMLQSGFLKVDDHVHWPGEQAPLTKSMEMEASGMQISGQLVEFDPSETEKMLAEFDQRLSDGWLPFLLLERRWEDNLYLLCDAGYTRGSFLKNLSMQQILQIAIQICELMSHAHAAGAIYLDHKLLHYYWNDLRKQVVMIDWNIGRWNPGTITPESIQFDLLQFSSRALHHLFTGRQAPGSVAVGANRPEEIENAPRQYKASYPYDVQKRLNMAEMQFLEKALNGGFVSADEMREALEQLLSRRL